MNVFPAVCNLSRLCLLGLIAIAATVGVSAQNGGSPQRVLTLGSAGGPISDLFVSSQGKFVPVEIPAYERGKSIPFSASTIELFRKVSDPVKGESYHPVGSWPWPTAQATSEVWLIVQQKSGEYRGLVLADDVTTFPRQSIRLINFATQPLGAKIKEQTFLIEPLTVQVVPATPDQRKRVDTLLALPNATGVWEPLPHPLIMYNENYRANLIVADGIDSAHYLVDFRPAAAMPLTGVDPGVDVVPPDAPAP